MRSLLALAVMSALPLAAVTPATDPAGTDTASADTSASTGASASASASSSVSAASGHARFDEALARIPAQAFVGGDGSEMLTYVDMTLVRERLGLTDDPTDEEFLDALVRANEVATWAQPPALFGPRSARFDEQRAEVGFTAADIERETAILAPPQTLYVVDTDVAPADVTAAVESDPLWSADLEMVSGPNGDHWSWGDDGFATQLERQSPLRPLGQGGQLALLDGEPATVVRTLDAAVVDAVLAAAGGVEPPLADDPVVSSVRAAIGPGQVVQAVALTVAPTMTWMTGRMTPAQVEAYLDEATLLTPYDGIYVVELVDDGEYRGEILLPHVSAESAAANAELVTEFLAGNDLATRRPLSELLPDASVEVDGTVVKVTLPDPGSYRIAVSMLYQGGLFPTG